MVGISAMILVGLRCMANTTFRKGTKVWTETTYHPPSYGTNSILCIWYCFFRRVLYCCRLVIDLLSSRLPFLGHFNCISWEMKFCVCKMTKIPARVQHPTKIRRESIENFWIPRPIQTTEVKISPWKLLHYYYSYNYSYYKHHTSSSTTVLYILLSYSW